MLNNDIIICNQYMYEKNHIYKIMRKYHIGIIKRLCHPEERSDEGSLF